MIAAAAKDLRKFRLCMNSRPLARSSMRILRMQSETSQSRRGLPTRKYSLLLDSPPFEELKDGRRLKPTLRGVNEYRRLIS